MGMFSVACGISNIAIVYKRECAVLPLKKNTWFNSRKWQPATLPIFGTYDSYGGLEDIVINDNTKFIAEHFGVTIDEFVSFLLNGQFTYKRPEAKAIFKKMKNQDEIKDWQSMWIDKKVYDFMSQKLYKTVFSPTELHEVVSNSFDVENASFIQSMFDSMAKNMTKEELAEWEAKHPYTISKKYDKQAKKFKNGLTGMAHLMDNLEPMSGQLTPQVLHLTPQCGEIRRHQILLEEFAKINKSYAELEDEEEEID